jgi:hypothetical protein
VDEIPILFANATPSSSISAFTNVPPRARTSSPPIFFTTTKFGVGLLALSPRSFCSPRIKKPPSIAFCSVISVQTYVMS